MREREKERERERESESERERERVEEREEGELERARPHAREYVITYLFEFVEDTHTHMKTHHRCTHEDKRVCYYIFV